MGIFNFSTTALSFNSSSRAFNSSARALSSTMMLWIGARCSQPNGRGFQRFWAARSLSFADQPALYATFVNNLPLNSISHTLPPPYNSYTYRKSWYNTIQRWPVVMLSMHNSCSNQLLALLVFVFWPDKMCLYFGLLRALASGIYSIHWWSQLGRITKAQPIASHSGQNNNPPEQVFDCFHISIFFFFALRAQRSNLLSNNEHARFHSFNHLLPHYVFLCACSRSPLADVMLSNLVPVNLIATSSAGVDASCSYFNKPV